MTLPARFDQSRVMTSGTRARGSAADKLLLLLLLEAAHVIPAQHCGTFASYDCLSSQIMVGCDSFGNVLKRLKVKLESKFGAIFFEFKIFFEKV